MRLLVIGLFAALFAALCADAQTTAGERLVFQSKIQHDSAFLSCCSERGGVVTVRGDQSLQGVATRLSEALTRSRPERVGWYWWWQLNRDAHLGLQMTPASGDELALRQRAIAALTQALRDDEPEVRRAAALALGRVVRDEEEADAAAQAIAPLLRDGKTDVRLGATLALGLTGRPLARDTLVGLIRGRADNEIKAFATVALGFCRDGIDTLLGLAQRSRSRELQNAALIGIKLHGGAGAEQQAARLMLGYLNNQRNTLTTRALAAAALTSVDEQGTSARALAALARHDKDALSSAALIALGGMLATPAADQLQVLGRVRLKSPAVGYYLLASGARKADGAAPALQRQVGERKLMGYAALGCGLLGDRSSSKALLQAAKKTRETELDAGAVALALGLLKHDALPGLVASWRKRAIGEVRTMLAEALALSGAAAGFEQIKLLYDDGEDDYEVRRAAVLAACKLGQAEAARAWLAASARSKRETERVAAIRLHGELTQPRHAAPPLLEALAGSEEETRTQAAYALGHLYDRARRVGSCDAIGSMTRVGRHMTHLIIYRDDLLEPLLAIP